MGEEKVGAPGARQIPAQYDLNKKWDACLDLGLRRFVYSSFTGAFTGLLLFIQKYQRTLTETHTILGVILSGLESSSSKNASCISMWKTSSHRGKKMEEIKHKYITVNDLKLHVAEIGNGQSVILFCHGFPEVWYTWRHQMVAAAKAGYRAIAPDYRGYGLSDPPSEPDKVTLFDFITDLRGLLDTMNISKVFVVGKDFGGPIASIFALLNKDRVYGVVTLGAPFMPVRSPSHHTPLPEGFYMNRWREPGRAESDFGRFDAKTVVRKIYIMFSKTEIPIGNENQEIMDLVKPSDPLPPWITEEEFAIYGDSYEKSGFQTALQVPYRWFNESSDMSILQDPKIEAPSLLIMGEKDYVFKFPGIEEYIKGDEINVYVPNLEVKYIPEGSHFVHEQFPGRVNELLLGFLNKHRESLSGSVNAEEILV